MTLLSLVKITANLYVRDITVLGSLNNTDFYAFPDATKTQLAGDGIYNGYSLIPVRYMKNEALVVRVEELEKQSKERKY